MTESRVTYAFGPLERRGILGPVRAGQAGLIAGGGLVAIVALDTSPSAAGALLGAAAVTVALAAAFAPLGGRTLQEWLPVALAFAGRRLGARGWSRSTAATAGGLARSAGRGPLSRRDPAAVAPGPLGGVRIVAANYGEREIGALSERGGRRLTAVLACRVAAFSLLDRDAQERRLARWGLVLSGAAGTAIRRIQWIERTAPAQGDELARWVHDERDPEVPLRGTPMIESYLELISSCAKVSQEHEILVAVQVDGRRVRERGAGAVTRALMEETERVAQELETAEVRVLGALGPRQLARALRTAFDPYARAELAALESADPAREGLSEVNAWPLGARESWDYYQSDGALHATYWIGAWPRVDVSPMFMDALLGPSGAVRTVAVTFEPLAPDRSTREVEAAITRDRADQELRSRFGQSETARQRQAADAAIRREAELAAGHAEVRLSGFVTVSGRDPDDLRRACAKVLEHAARARLELHRLYGQQADAFTFTLPLCRGLR
ncbi:MAG TPA: SCO6880 family protein [Solirubrobacteraceae bacterium]|nr:SCO6880 family protein [Solirubrobacteraceae bacterium]